MTYWLAMAVLVAALLGVHATKRWALEWLLKPAASLTFILAGYAAGALDTVWGSILFGGLILAAGGDVLLIPKNDRRYFLAGLVSFLLGHVAYAVAFYVRGIELGATGVATLVMILLGLPILRWLWPKVEQKMRVPVAAYIVVITLMVGLAGGSYAARGNPLLVAGAFGFYLSDISVANDRFAGAGLGNRAWGLSLYFFSQMVLANTVAG